MKPMESVETTGSHNSHSHGPLSYNENGLMNSDVVKWFLASVMTIKVLQEGKY